MLYHSMPMPPEEVSVAELLEKEPGPTCCQPVVEPLQRAV